MVFTEQPPRTEGQPQYTPVVIFGGWGTGRRRNGKIEDHLQALQYPTLLINRPERGREPSSNQFPRVHQIPAEAALDQIESANLTRINVLAHSQGAIIASIATILAQQRHMPISIDKLILVAPATKVGHDTPTRLSGRFVFQRRNRDSDLRGAAQDLAENALTRPRSLIEEVRAISQTRLQDFLREIRDKSPQTQIYILGFSEDTVFHTDAVEFYALAGAVSRDNIRFFPGRHDSFYEPHFIEDVIQPLLQR